MGNNQEQDPIFRQPELASIVTQNTTLEDGLPSKENSISVVEALGLDSSVAPTITDVKPKESFLKYFFKNILLMVLTILLTGLGLCFVLPELIRLLSIKVATCVFFTLSLFILYKAFKKSKIPTVQTLDINKNSDDLTEPSAPQGNGKSLLKEFLIFLAFLFIVFIIIPMIFFFFLLGGLPGIIKLSV